MLEAARFGLVVHHDDSVREYAYHDQAVLDAAAGERLDRREHAGGLHLPVAVRQVLPCSGHGGGRRR